MLSGLWFAPVAGWGGPALHPLLYGAPVVAGTLVSGPGSGAAIALWALLLWQGLVGTIPPAMPPGLAAMVLGATLARRHW